MEKDVYKLDTRVTILFSRAQVDALREIAHEKQVSVSGLIRRWVTSELMVNHMGVLRENQALVRKETQNG